VIAVQYGETLVQALAQGPTLQRKPDKSKLIFTAIALANTSAKSHLYRMS
jgi:hypothetical protein